MDFTVYGQRYWQLLLKITREHNQHQKEADTTKATCKKNRTSQEEISKADILKYSGEFYL